MGVRLKTADPIWWALFSAGGTVAAFLVPVHILVTGLGIGLGWIPLETLSYERVRELLENPLVRLYLLVLISLPLFHSAHRLRHILIDLGRGALRTPISFLCYGCAIAGSATVAPLRERRPPSGYWCREGRFPIAHSRLQRGDSVRPASPCRRQGCRRSTPPILSKRNLIPEKSVY